MPQVDLSDEFAPDDEDGIIVDKENNKTDKDNLVEDDEDESPPAPPKCEKRACKLYGTVFRFASELAKHEG